MDANSPHPCAANSRTGWRALVVAGAVCLVVGCGEDGPDGTWANYEPIEVDVVAEASAYNGGDVFEFVVDESGFVSAPAALPAGDVMVTLTYEGETPAPHSLVFEGLNDDQPVVAVDLPGSNNGVVAIPAGHRIYFDGAPGNREKGYEGHVGVAAGTEPTEPLPVAAVVSWKADGLEFTAEPTGASPAEALVALELTVGDGLPHSIAFEDVRGEQPLVAVDGPGANRRTISLPAGTYVYFCAVPGHREAGMEGLVTFR